MNRLKQLALIAGASLFAIQPAQATTYVVNHVLDPAVIGPNINQEMLAAPFTAGVGDTIEFHLTFTTGSATIVGESYLWLLALTHDGDAVIDTNDTWTFVNPSANLLSGPFMFTETSSYVHVGGTLWASTYRLDFAPITFSGIDLTVEITGVQPIDYDPQDGIIDAQSADPREYYGIALFTDVSRAGPVPEPATWAMMIGGFALVGAAARRRRTAVSFS